MSGLSALTLLLCTLACVLDTARAQTGDVNVTSLAVGVIIVTAYVLVTVSSIVYWYRNLREKEEPRSYNPL